MLDLLRHWLRSQSDTPYVRPWGLAAPILVLIIALPLLRPLRQPGDIGENERQRLATIEAIVEHHNLTLEGTSFYPPPPRHPALRNHPAPRVTQPPVLAALLAGPYWIMHRLGLTFHSNTALAAYLLTLLGATLPVALSAGVIYRMGRLLELRRPWRMLLTFACIFATGLISYATVLNSHAPAASLVLAACGALFHGAITRHQSRATGWLALAGFSASLAAVVDLGAIVFLILFVAIILALRWPVATRTIGIGCYILGAAPPLLLHIALTVPLTGDIRPGFLHSVEPLAQTASLASDDDDEDIPKGHTAHRIIDGLIGAHGLLSHFPILLLGLAGIGIILHRNWPAVTKLMAAATLAAAILVIGAYVILDADWDQPMFAARWFILFTPLLMFWAGAWLRQTHSPATWITAAVLLAFSTLTSLFGAIAPLPRSRPGDYTALSSARQTFRPAPPPR